MRLSVNLGYDLLMVMLETDHITWEEYAESVPPDQRPPEYKDHLSFLKNKGKASMRIIKDGEWKNAARRKGLLDT